MVWDQPTLTNIDHHTAANSELNWSLIFGIQGRFKRLFANLCRGGSDVEDDAYRRYLKSINGVPNWQGRLWHRVASTVPHDNLRRVGLPQKLTRTTGEGTNGRCWMLVGALLNIVVGRRARRNSRSLRKTGTGITWRDHCKKLGTAAYHTN